jgi:hypothetical protein
MKCTRIIGASFTKLRLFSHKMSYHYQHTFSTFPSRALCRSSKTVLKRRLFKQAVFHLVVNKKASSECIFWEQKKCKSDSAKSVPWGGWGRTVHPIVVTVSIVRRLLCGLALSWKRRTLFILLFGQILPIHCLNVFNVYTCLYELIMATLFKTSTNKFPFTVPEDINQDFTHISV